MKYLFLVLTTFAYADVATPRQIYDIEQKKAAIEYQTQVIDDRLFILNEVKKVRPLSPYEKKVKDMYEAQLKDLGEKALNPKVILPDQQKIREKVLLNPSIKSN